jgi:hypothetical protein
MRNIVKATAIFVLAAPLAIVGCMADNADETVGQAEQAEQGKLPLPTEIGSKAPGSELGPITAPVGGQQQLPAAGCISNMAPLAQAPGYVAPNYNAPSFQAPTFPAPTFGAPSYAPPVYNAPNYGAPSYQTPSPVPGCTAPVYTAPHYAAPSYAAPIYEAPTYEAPTFPAPIYNPPTYGQQQMLPCQPLNPAWAGGFAQAPSQGLNVGQGR